MNRPTDRLCSFIVVVASTLVAATTAPTAAAQAEQSAVPGRAPCVVQAGERVFALDLQALKDGTGTELAVRFTPNRAECRVPAVVKKVLVKPFTVDGTPLPARNFFDVPAPEGRASIELGGLERRQRLQIRILVQTPELVETEVAFGATEVLLRPNVKLSDFDAPVHALKGDEVVVSARIAETRGDVAATATVALTDGEAEVARQDVNVSAGGGRTVEFPLTVDESRVYSLAVTALATSPREVGSDDNEAIGVIDVTDLALDPEDVLATNLVGYGSQFNHFLSGDFSDIPEAEFPALEEKVAAQRPQFVRVFLGGRDVYDARFPKRLPSFIRAVELAHRAGAEINVTWQGGTFVGTMGLMPQIADTLADVVTNRGIPSIWVTLWNEVNSTQVTPAQYEHAYRELDRLLRERGVRDRIRFMGGDLVEDGRGSNPRAAVPRFEPWLDHMATHMTDILDAYSFHAYWSYWDMARGEFRLRQTYEKLVSLPVSGRLPTYVTEYAVRGIGCCRDVDPPGPWQDGTPMSRTNVNAFQHIWFNVRTAKYGYRGTVKWDSYYSIYNPNNPQSYYMIGDWREGWPLYPVYHATRLFTTAVRPGSSIVGFKGEPGAPTQRDGNAGTRQLGAFVGPDGGVSIVGIDAAGGQLNAAVERQVAYSVGGLPAERTFDLYVWNERGDGITEHAGVVRTNAAGVLRVRIPLHAAFAITES